MFPYQISNKGVTVFIDGQPKQFASTHSQYQAIVDAIASGVDQAVREATDVRQAIFDKTLGRVRVEGNEIFLADKKVTGTLVDRILAMIAMNNNAVDGFIRFLDRMYLNLSKQTIDELFDFIEACDLPITSDGCFLAYKYVQLDYKDCFSGTFDNSVGSVCEMPRNEVDDRRDVTCSTGLHVCSYAYLGSYVLGKRVMVVKVSPEDVVSVPTEYHNAKMRTCRYEVVNELEDFEIDGIKPWFDDQYDEPDVDETEDDEPDNDTDSVDIASEVIRSNIQALGPDRNAIQDYLIELDVSGEDETVLFHDWNYEEDGEGGLIVNIWYQSEDPDEADLVVRVPIDSGNDVDEDEAFDGDDILVFDPQTVIDTLDQIGADESAINTYLQTLDDELVEEMYDWIVKADPLSGNIHVSIWLDDNVLGVSDHVVKAEVATPEPVKTSGRGKLTPDQVREIKALKSEWADGNITLTAIGKQYGVHREQIARIFRGETWKDIT